MSLNVCAHCTTKFSIGALHCPQCGNADFYEEGSMPKIRRDGGATYPVGVIPPGPEALPPAVDEEWESPGTGVAMEGEEGTPDGTEHELVVDDDAPDGPYAGMLRGDLQEALAARGLPTSGNKPELIARLMADDAAKAEQDEADGELGTVPVDPE